MLEQIYKQYPKDANVQSKVHFREVTGSSVKLTSESRIADAIGKAVEVLSPAFAIRVDEDTICYVQTIEEAEHLTGALKKPFIEAVASSGNQLQKVGFSEKVEFYPVKVAFNEIISTNEALTLLQQTIEAVVQHTASSKDTFWDLAIKNNMKVEEIQALNPDLDPTKINEGDIIVLSREKKLLNVVTEETENYEVDVHFQVEEQEDDTLLKGMTKKVQEGKKGKKVVEALVVRENGVEIKREIIKETILEDPVNEIVVIGTKKAVSTPKPTKTPSRSGSTNTTPAPTKKPGSTPAPTTKPVEATPAPSPSTKPESPAVPSTSKGVTGQDIVDFAMKQLGKPYSRSGAAGPNAFDCSGLTVYVYKHFGINIQRMNQHTLGIGVAKEDMIPGDIITFTDPGHVGIYIGDGNMIHASSTEGKVVIKTIYTKNYIRRYRASRRIIY